MYECIKKNYVFPFVCDYSILWMKVLLPILNMKQYYVLRKKALKKFWWLKKKISLVTELHSMYTVFFLFKNTKQCYLIKFYKTFVS